MTDVDPRVASVNRAASSRGEISGSIESQIDYPIPNVVRHTVSQAVRHRRFVLKGFNTCPHTCHANGRMWIGGCPAIPLRLPIYRPTRAWIDRGAIAGALG